MPVEQLNVEYFFRLIYDCFHGSCGSSGWSQFSAWLAHLWIWIASIGYLLSLVGFFVIVYVMVRLFELRKREEEYYGTLILAPEANEPNPRWAHIQSLMESGEASQWREAIIEADIMLDTMLARQGYEGDTVGDKLKNVESSDFNTLNDAWQAHKVRNQIAHEGSAFEMSELLAHRTIQRYEAVFREFELI